MPQSYACLYFHLIFSTKDRRPFIAPEFRDRVYEYIGGTLDGQECRLVCAGGMPDHLHLLASLHRDIAVSEAVRLIKSNSSKWIRETFPKHRQFNWQAGYGAFSVSFSNTGHVKAYIGNQEEHHRRTDFRAEFVEFLKKHECEYDERYLWD